MICRTSLFGPPLRFLIEEYLSGCYMRWLENLEIQLDKYAISEERLKQWTWSIVCWTLIELTYLVLTDFQALDVNVMKARIVLVYCIGGGGKLQKSLPAVVFRTLAMQAISLSVFNHASHVEFLRWVCPVVKSLSILMRYHIVDALSSEDLLFRLTAKSLKLHWLFEPIEVEQTIHAVLLIVNVLMMVVLVWQCFLRGCTHGLKRWLLLAVLGSAVWLSCKVEVNLLSRRLMYLFATRNKLIDYFNRAGSESKVRVWDLFLPLVDDLSHSCRESRIVLQALSIGISFGRCT
jgi:hypothetical protein